MLKDLKYKDVKSIYKIDENGNIYSKYKNDYLIPRQDKNGYLEISLRGKKRIIYARVSVLVAYNFIGKPPEKMKDPTVDHIDGNKTNNHYLNLRWLERAENSSVRKIRGKTLGELNHESKLKEEQVILICELLLKNDMTLQEIADMFNVHKTTISNINKKKNWKHIANRYNFPENLVKRNSKR